MRTIRLAAGFSVVAIAIVGLIGPVSAGDGPVQDGRIAKNPTGPFKGAGLINETGIGQTQQKHASPGETRIFFVKIKNLGASNESHIKGSGSSQCFRVRYFTGFVGGTDVTSQTVAGADGTIEPRSVAQLRFEVKVRRCAEPGDTKTVRLNTKPVNLPSTHDRVRGRVIAQ